MATHIEEENPHKLNTALGSYDDNMWFIPALVPDTRIGWKNFARIQNKTLFIRVDLFEYRWHPNGHIEQYDQETNVTYRWGPKPTIQKAITRQPAGAFFQFHKDGSVEARWANAECKVFWGNPRKTVWVEGTPEYEDFCEEAPGGT
jgi:hypothetical protein